MANGRDAECSKIDIAIQAINQRNVMKEVLESLDCPVCLESLCAPIFMCETGHNICGDCRQKISYSKCPICQSFLTQQRNYALENISSKLVGHPCPNANFGCTEIFPSKKFNLHLKKCLYKPFLCIIGREFDTCTHKVSFATILDHFKIYHSEDINKAGIDIVLSNFDISKNFDGIKLIQFNDYNFLIDFKIDLEVEQTACCCVYFVGTKEDASMWKYEFSLIDYKSPINSIIFTGKCYSVVSNSQDIFDNGNCIGIPLKMLKKFIGWDKKIAFKFSFISLKSGNEPNNC